MGYMLRMNFFTSRNGKQYGPYPMESLAEMIRKAQVAHTDFIFLEGWSNWRTVSDYLKSPSPHPHSTAVPPPLPQQPPLLPVNEQLVVPASSGIAVALPAALEGAAELEQAVMEGGRFVVFQYCFSVLIMTFKRSSSVLFLRSGEDGFGQALSHSMISLTVGWWGIPWGPIWTIGTVFKNAWGGLDVTREVLTQKLGIVRATQIMAQRRPPTPRGYGMTLFRWGLIGIPALLILLLMLMPVLSAFNDTSGNQRPESVEVAGFAVANRQINAYHGDVAYGNSPEARAAAATFSTQMKQMSETLFESGKKGGLSLSDNQFLTHCELGDSQCVFIVHVPKLRKFSVEAKESLGTLAWITAQNALQKQGITNSEMQLAVGLRGFALYDRVLLGTLKSNAETANEGLNETVVGSNPEKRLHPFFQSAAGDSSLITRSNVPPSHPGP